MSAREARNARALRERPRLRAAVLGAGHFGRFHALKIAAHPRLRLAAVVDPHPERAVDVAAEGHAQALTSHGDILGAVDLAIIATPGRTHAPLACAFLKAGAHVLVEKPIALTLADADAVIRLGHAQGRVVQAGHQERALFVQSGILDIRARPRAIACVRKGPFVLRNAELGVELDLMTHDLDLVHLLNPERVVEVRATGRRVKSNACDEALAELKLADGCQVRVAASRIAPARERTMRIDYAEGTIAIDFLARRVVNTTPYPVRDVFGAGDGHDPLAFALDRFVKAIDEGASPLASGEEARRALETALRVGAALTSEAVAG